MEPMSVGDPMTHLTAGAAVVYFIQWAKTSNLPLLNWIGHDTIWLNRIVSIVLAAAVTMGISYTGDATQGWVIHVPPATALMGAAWEFAKQFASQQMIYDTVTKRPVVTVAAVNVAPPPTATSMGANV